MRHRVKGRNLSRTASHRLATLRSLATSLLRNKKIKTTTAKAKELRRFVEPLITKAKTGSVAARRHVARHINDKGVINELFNDIVQKIGERAGGYTRVIKLGNRIGDAAEMSLIELVDYNDLVAKKPRKSKPKAASKKAGAEPEVEEAEVVEETTDDTTEEKTEDKKKTTSKTKTKKAEEGKEKKSTAKKTEKKGESKASSTKKSSTKAKSSTKKTSGSTKKGS